MGILGHRREVGVAHGMFRANEHTCLTAAENVGREAAGNKAKVMGWALVRGPPRQAEQFEFGFSYGRIRSQSRGSCEAEQHY